MLEPINKILNARANKYGLKNVADAARICFEAKAVSDGEFEPISFRNGILTISVANNILASKIQMKSSSIIKKINQKVGGEKIKRVKFRILN